MRRSTHQLLALRIASPDLVQDLNKPPVAEIVTNSGIVTNSKNSNVKYGPDSFGDIMSKKETNISVVGEFTPLERIVITANGNLQRILSAYYGAPISVVIKKCEKKSDYKYDREVDLVVNGQVACTARGEIVLHSDECIEAIESKSIGVGQLFRFLGVLPTFTLLGVGRANNQLWREYELSCPQLKCTFVETFSENFLDICSQQ